MGLPVGAGRSFLPTDGRDAVAVVSESLERRVFDGTAVGQTFATSDSAERYTVIGVVPDVRSREVAADDSPAFYIRNHRLTTTQFVVRLDAGAPPSIDALRQAIQERHPQSVVTSAFLMSDRLAVLLAAERFRAAMSAAFGGVALVMAAVGLFALAARRVAERRREIGVRIALGAGPSRIRRLVLRDGLLNVAFGLAAGLPAAFAASQLTTSYLYGVTPTSPRVFVGAALVLGAVALVATLIPARRASRIDPLLALRD
jgi:ABC-type antimicrobial peptide transport system permease subunit